MKKTILASFFAWVLTFHALAQNTGRLELTQTDIISLGQLDGTKISVHGFYLGMKKEEARQLLLYNSNKITVDYNSWNIVNRPINDTIENGCYVFDVDSLTGQQKNCILYIGWNTKDPGMDRITIFSEFMPYAKGNTSQLFSADVVSPQSAFHKKWLGKATLTRPGSHFTSWFYQSRNIIFIENSVSGQPKYYFMLTKKAVF